MVVWMISFQSVMSPPKAAANAVWSALAEPVSSSRRTAVSTTTVLLPPGAMEARAADRAALVRLCLDGLHDPAVGAYYRAAVAAHPTLAAGIGPDCSLAPTAP